MADLLDPAWSAREEPADAHARLPSSSPWTNVEWAVVTRSGMLQARCGHPYGTPPRPCHAWRLSSPDGTAWRRACHTCGTDQVPLPILAAGPDAIAASVASTRAEDRL
jgi:hypothetical protein